MQADRWVDKVGLLVLVIVFFGSVTKAEDNQVLVVDGVATNFPGYPFIIGDTGTNNYLIITNGGSASSAGVWVGNNDTASGNGMFVIGTNSFYEGPLTIGIYGSRNKLVISDGGTVHNNSAEVGGYNTSSGNTVVVDGSNSVWTIDASLDVGWLGSSNQLLVVNGGRVNTKAHSSVGQGGGSHDNLVQVIGHGSVWNGGVTVGFYGVNNRLIISEGGQLTNGNIVLGSSTSSTSNVVCIMGTNSQIDVDSFTIGDSGSSNLMIIQDGGNAIARNGKVGNKYVGGSDAISNTLLISGSNSVCTIRDDLFVGYSTSDSSLRVVDGGKLMSGNLYITGISNNLVQVSNAVLVVSNLFNVATGPLEIDGGECWTRQLTCDRAGGGQILINSGLLVVTQSSTINYGTNSFAVGTTAGEVGTLKFLTGSHSLVADGGVLLGPNAGSRGELFIAGPNVLARGPLYVGETGLTHGSGFASITGGAVLEANMIVCGSGDLDSIENDGGVFQFTIPNPSVLSLNPNRILLTNGTISFRNITNADPEYLVPSPSSITFGGSTSFRLFNSASVPLDTYEFGTSFGNRYARLILTSGVTQWNCTNLVINAGGELICSNTAPTIGLAGGALLVTNGGKVKNMVSATEFNRWMSNFSLTITGAGTQWTNSSDFAVGRLGASNRCLINGGATLQDQTGYMGFVTGSSNNEVRVSGMGSLWANASSLVIGQSGSGNILYIENGGEVRSSQMTIGAGSSSINNQYKLPMVVWSSRTQ